jgi:hypothetical protein
MAAKKKEPNKLLEMLAKIGDMDKGVNEVQGLYFSPVFGDPGVPPDTSEWKQKVQVVRQLAEARRDALAFSFVRQLMIHFRNKKSLSKEDFKKLRELGEKYT